MLQIHDEADCPVRWSWLRMRKIDCMGYCSGMLLYETGITIEGQQSHNDHWVALGTSPRLTMQKTSLSN